MSYLGRADQACQITYKFTAIGKKLGLLLQTHADILQIGLDCAKQKKI